VPLIEANPDDGGNRHWDCPLDRRQLKLLSTSRYPKVY